MSRTRIAALAFSAAALVGLALSEDYSDRAIIPVPGDVPTIGFGTTDGVKMGDKITPPVALARALRDVQKFEGALKRCVTVPLYQHEYDTYVSFAYNVGSGRFCESTLVKVLNAGQYEAACAHLLGFVCGPATKATAAKPGEKCYSKRKPMRVLRGLTLRRQAEYRQCIGQTSEGP